MLYRVVYINPRTQETILGNLVPENKILLDLDFMRAQNVDAWIQDQENNRVDEKKFKREI